MAYTMAQRRSFCNRCQRLVVTAFKEEVGEVAGPIIDILIPLVLPIIMELFKGCLQQQSADEVMKQLEDIDLLERWLVRRAVLRVLQQPTTSPDARQLPAYKLVGAFVRAAAKASKPDVELAMWMADGAE